MFVINSFICESNKNRLFIQLTHTPPHTHTCLLIYLDTHLYLFSLFAIILPSSHDIDDNNSNDKNCRLTIDKQHAINVCLYMCVCVCVVMWVAAGLATANANGNRGRGNFCCAR